jgi:hypothetical protein
MRDNMPNLLTTEDVSERSQAAGTSERTSRDERIIDAGDIDGLLDFALRALEPLQLQSGLFCFDRRFGDTVNRGESVRYTILVLLGLLRCATHDQRRSPFDVDALHAAVVPHLDAMGVGDLSLLLWAQSRMRDQRAVTTLAALRARSSSDHVLARLDGMEAAWFVIGAVESHVAGTSSRQLFERAYTHLQTRRSPSSPLFRHTGLGRGRALLPNFATQIYTLLALAETARHALAADAAHQGRALADALISLRLPDGGWPWLYHSEQCVVVEPYEVYSVHQDAMAPMALFALSEALSDTQYARAAVEGLFWCFGQNELGFQFYDVENRFAHRSIRRRGAAHSLNLWANGGLSGLLGSAARTHFGRTEINQTCRPYHLGWILEAWSGRQALRNLVRSR